MQKDDARKLDHATLEALRIRAVRSVQDGESPEDVARTLRVTPRAMYRWLALYRRGGWNALKAKPLAGRPPKLDGGMLKWLYNTITQKNPLQLRFQFALWTREMVAELITRKYGIRLARNSVGRVIEFLKRLLVGETRKIFLIVDRGPAHRAKKTKAFIATLAGRLRLFFLPPYSPDRNPDELVWKHLKTDTVGRMVVTDKTDFKSKVVSSLRSLQRNPRKICSFFQKPPLRYAA
jgi:transposase